MIQGLGVQDDGVHIWGGGGEGFRMTEYTPRKLSKLGYRVHKIGIRVLDLGQP